MPAKIIAQTAKAEKRNFPKGETPNFKGNFKGFPDNDVRQQIIVPISRDFVGNEVGKAEHELTKIRKLADLRDGFVAIKENKKFRFEASNHAVAASAYGDYEEAAVSKKEIEDARNGIKIYYDFEAIKRELLAEIPKITKEMLLRSIPHIMLLKEGRSQKVRAELSVGNPGFDFEKYKEILEKISPFLLYRFKSKQTFHMDKDGIDFAKDRESQIRPFYYNHLPNLQTDKPFWGYFTDRARPIKLDDGKEVPQAVLTPQGELRLIEIYKSAVNLQLRCAAENNEGCFLMEPNAFLYGLEESNRAVAKDIFLQAAVEAIRDFKNGKTDDEIKKLGPIFLQSKAAKRRAEKGEEIDLSQIHQSIELHIVEGMDASYPHRAGLKVAQQVMGDALGPVGNGALGKRADNGAEENLCRQMPMMLCVMAPQNNPQLLDPKWLEANLININASQKSKPKPNPLYEITTNVDGLGKDVVSYNYPDKPNGILANTTLGAPFTFNFNGKGKDYEILSPEHLYQGSKALMIEKGYNKELFGYGIEKFNEVLQYEEGKQTPDSLQRKFGKGKISNDLFISPDTITIEEEKKGLPYQIMVEIHMMRFSQNPELFDNTRKLVEHYGGIDKIIFAEHCPQGGNPSNPPRDNRWGCVVRGGKVDDGKNLQGEAVKEAMERLMSLTKDGEEVVKRFSFSSQFVKNFKDALKPEVVEALKKSAEISSSDLGKAESKEAKEKKEKLIKVLEAFYDNGITPYFRERSPDDGLEGLDPAGKKWTEIFDKNTEYNKRAKDLNNTPLDYEVQLLCAEIQKANTVEEIDELLNKYKELKDPDPQLEKEVSQDQKLKLIIKAAKSLISEKGSDGDALQDKKLQDYFGFGDSAKNPDKEKGIRIANWDRIFHYMRQEASEEYYKNVCVDGIKSDSFSVDEANKAGLTQEFIEQRQKVFSENYENGVIKVNQKTFEKFASQGIKFGENDFSAPDGDHEKCKKLCRLFIKLPELEIAKDPPKSEEKGWKYDDNQKIPGTKIQATLCQPVIGTYFKETVWKDDERRNDFRVIRDVYTSKEEILNTFIDILCRASQIAGLSKEEAFEAIELAKKQGGISNKKSAAGSDRVYDKINSDEKNPDLSRFSRQFQKLAKECGIYTGRKMPAKDVGCRLTFVPEEAVREFEKLSDEHILERSEDTKNIKLRTDQAEEKRKEAGKAR